MKRTALAACTLLASTTFSLAASAETFPSGSIIIPMDTDYQDEGMLKAYGLVYQLLLHDIPVNWVISSSKQFGDADFTADAVDHATGDTVTAHGYRGGPWVVDEQYSAAATTIIDAWQAANTTTVHVASAPFDGDVARRLIVAPTIAMFADGNQKIARKYVQAAGIPDSVGDTGWPDTSPDMLDVDEVMGPTDANHADGALFDEDGDPIYCQFMSMHWGVKDAQDHPEVVAEVRSFLSFPTHFFAQCQAVNAFENDPVNGLFLTTNGFEIDSRPDDVDFYNASSPFAQIDGAFETVGGSEPSYTLPAGDSYKAGDITMITAAGTPEGVRDVWMTGYLDGTCAPDLDVCFNVGKVSYLGGHEYKTDVPISAHADSQGTRLFLNSLFEAQCATGDGQPSIWFNKQAPDTTTTPEVTYTISYSNAGPGVALNVVITDEIPTGSTFVSATGGGMLTGSEILWSVGNLGDGESGSVSFTVALPSYGDYDNTAQMSYRVGLNERFTPSNTTTTTYEDPGAGGAAGGAGAGGHAGAGGAAGMAGSAGTAGVGGTAGSSGMAGSAGTVGSGGSSGTAGFGGVGGTGASAGSGGTGAAAGAGGAGASAGSATSGSDTASEDTGGCSCRIQPARTPTPWLLAGLLGLVGMFRRRRTSSTGRELALGHDGHVAKALRGHDGLE